MDHTYGIELSYIFKIPSISNEKPSILIGNIRFQSKKAIFQIKKFEILGILKKLGILTEKPEPRI